MGAAHRAARLMLPVRRAWLGAAKREHGARTPYAELHALHELHGESCCGDNRLGPSLLRGSAGRSTACAVATMQGLHAFMNFMVNHAAATTPFVKGECGQVHGVRRGAALPASATENRKLKTENQCSSASVFICVHPSSSVQRSPVAGPTTLRQIGNRWAVRQCVGASVPAHCPLYFLFRMCACSELPVTKRTRAQSK
jgi:hypothetical protein